MLTDTGYNAESHCHQLLSPDNGNRVLTCLSSEVLPMTTSEDVSAAHCVIIYGIHHMTLSYVCGGGFRTGSGPVVNGHTYPHLNYLTSWEYLQLSPPPPTHFLCLVMTHPVNGTTYVGDTSEENSHFIISLGHIRAGLTGICAEESELFNSDLMESGDTGVSNAAPHTGF